MSITTIIFDLNEVSLNGLKALHVPLAAKLGHDPASGWPAFHNNGIDEYFCGRITEDELLQRVLQSTGWKISIPEFKTFIRECFTQIEGTRAIIEALKVQGYKLGLLSDHGRDWAEHCEETFSYHHLYDCVVYSYEIGATKQEQWVFRHILKRIGAEPEETLFIDDRNINIAVAAQIGLQTILFTSPEDLKIQLHEVGIRI